MNRLADKTAIVTGGAVDIGRACVVRLAVEGEVRLMSKNDALTYAPEKIRVNWIHPACIWTPMVENHMRAKATWRGATPPSAACRRSRRSARSRSSAPTRPAP